MNFDIITYLFSFGFLYIYGRLAIHFSPAIYLYLVNLNSGLTVSLEKPRILFHLIGLGFMHLMFSFHQTNKNSEIPVQVIILLVFFLGVYLCLLSWEEKFKSTFLDKIEIKSFPQLSENFNLSISDEHLTQLYNEMVRFDLIDQNMTSLQSFKNVLIEDWKAHHSKIHLKMDGPSCREFYDNLIKAFPNNSITLKNMFISSDLIRRPDGKLYKYNTLKNALTRTPISKQHEILKIIFQNFKSEGDL